MVNVDIRTRVELKNETIHNNGTIGSAGRVALIGAFPSGKQRTFAAESFAKLCNHYGVKLNSTAVNWYSGVRAARRIFMEGINGYRGASSVTCVNICKLKPNYFEDVSPLYKDTYDEIEQGYDTEKKTLTGSLGINTQTNKYIPDGDALKQDVSLSFEKLKKALFSIADEDMDLLFIANDLWEIFDNPLKERIEYPALYYGKLDAKEADALNYEQHYVVVNEYGVPVTVKEPVVDANGNQVTDENGNLQYTEHLKCPFLTRFREDGVEELAWTPATEVVDENDKYANTSTPRKSQIIDENEKFVWADDGHGSKKWQFITEETKTSPFTGLMPGEKVQRVYFDRDGLNWQVSPAFYKRQDILDNVVRDKTQEKQPATSYIVPTKKKTPVLLNTDMAQWYIDTLFGSSMQTVTVKDPVTNENVSKKVAKQYIKPFRIVVKIKDNTPVFVDGALKCPYKTKEENGNIVYDKVDGKLQELGEYGSTGDQNLAYGEKLAYGYFFNDGSSNASSPQWYTTHADKLYYNNFYGTLKEYGELKDSNGVTVYGITDKGKYIRNIGDVYDYIIDFVDNEFTNHRPVNYVGAVKTRGKPEGSENNYTLQGIGSEIIRVNSERYNYEDETNATKKARYTPTESNPYADITTWGAVDIANLFKRKSNELTTCGLFYQGGIIGNGSSDGEEVDAMELAAHITGWICSIPLEQDLTYQTIPGLLAVDEEPFLGEYDAGNMLNLAGIQVIRPKSRLDKTFYVNNSIMPSGWHTNHVRSVTYLLKRLQFESGLGINNYVSNTEAYRAMLDSVAKEVMSECDIIRGVTVGDVEIINHYHIYIPISIMLSGVVTLINIGVGMTLDETGAWGSYIRTNSGAYVKSSNGYTYSI